ncbi:hypothetical protein ADUPG1_000801 [Aduncisulcus paluster]|uniref:Uncharacterized protein n=1 Tax=Aduncisulcus paluster TaxID=2918883 RepID=A0ABQ5K9X4_9EUKA|nr:hypothetical protein ADUPG1_000801 [Aduncisulcus paluster]
MGTLSRTRPFDEISIDTFGPLTMDKETGCSYIIVLIDNFSRFIELFPCRSTTAKEAVECICLVIARHGIPRRIRTDAGSQYKNSLMNELTTKFGIEHTIAVVDHHQANGIVERFNREILQQLKYYFTSGWNKEEWAPLVPLIMATLNNRKSERFGFSPFEVLYGVQAKQTPLTEIIKDEEEKTSYGETWKEFMRKNQLFREQMYSKITKIQDKGIDKQKEINEQESTFEIGEKVLLFNKNKKRKVDPTNLGPFTIKNKVRDYYFELESINGGEFITSHISDLRKFKEPEEETLEELQKRSEQADRREFKVEKIVAHRGKGKRSIKFRVKWEGYSSKENTWQSWSDIKDTEAYEKYVVGHKTLHYLFSKKEWELLEKEQKTAKK